MMYFFVLRKSNNKHFFMIFFRLQSLFGILIQPKDSNFKISNNDVGSEMHNLNAENQEIFQNLLLYMYSSNVI